MSKNKKETIGPGIEDVENALTKAEQFIEDNQRLLTIIFVIIVAVVGSFFGYKKLFLAPREKEAEEQMFMAEQYFEKDSFNLALNGDGNNYGFLKIIDDYSLTKSANLSHYYAGICYLHLGNFKQSIDQLKKFNADDKLISSIAIGATGDAYVELGKKIDALDYYLKAANNHKNEFTSPIYLMKAGQLYEFEGNFAKALDTYNEIKDKYSKSFEGRQIDKYITRVQVKIGQ
jgi:tetratricopeptide (TPR) repeat protein